MAHITVIGTSHIAEQSIKAIKRAFADTKPDIIAVELDRQRLHALLTDQKPSYSPTIIRRIGVAGYLFAVIGGILQRRLGKMVGMQPGADMKQAVMLAQKNNIPLLLIDQDIQITLRKLSKQLTRKEKWRLLADLLFSRWKKQPKVKIDLSKVPEAELISILIEQLKERYPAFYNVLISERNTHMARKLAAAALQEKEKNILVVVGAGHQQGLMEELHQTITLLKDRAQRQHHG